MFVNDGLKGNMACPKTPEAAILFLKGWNTSIAEKQTQDNAKTATREARVAFVQPSARTRKLVKCDCYLYGKWGHHVRNCPDLMQEEKGKLYKGNEWVCPRMWVMPARAATKPTVGAAVNMPRRARMAAAPKTEPGMVNLLLNENDGSSSSLC